MATTSTTSCACSTSATGSALLGITSQDYGGVHLQLRDLEQRAVEHPDPAGPDRQHDRQRVPARPGVRPAVYGALTTRLGPSPASWTPAPRSSRSSSTRVSDPSCCGSPVRSSTPTRSAPTARPPGAVRRRDRLHGHRGRAGGQRRPNGRPPRTRPARPRDHEGVGRKTRVLDTSPATWQMAFAGAATVRLDARYNLLRAAPGGGYGSWPASTTAPTRSGSPAPRTVRRGSTRAGGRSATSTPPAAPPGPASRAWAGSRSPP